MKRDLRKEVIWNASFLFSAILLTGWFTEFHFFRSIDIFLHDTYLVIAGTEIMIFLWVAQTFTRYTVIGLHRISQDSKVVAIFLMIVTTFLLLLVGFIFMMIF